MTDYEIERQVRQVLERFQQSNFTDSEARRCIANVIANKLKKHIKENNNGGDSKGKVA